MTEIFINIFSNKGPLSMAWLDVLPYRSESKKPGEGTILHSKTLKTAALVAWQVLLCQATSSTEEEKKNAPFNIDYNYQFKYLLNYIINWCYS